jgi:hypothetical protein
MASLESIIDDLAEKYDLPHKELGENHFAVEVKFEDDRSQVVEIAIRTDAGERDWILVQSEIGPVAELDALDLLERNCAVGYSFIAVAGDDAVVQAQIPLENCDVELCQEMILSVGQFADQLEEELLGGDAA